MSLCADTYNVRELDAQRLRPRHITKLVEFWQARHGLEIDGLFGPQTRQSLSSETGDAPAGSLLGEPSDQAPLDRAMRAWPAFDGPLEQIPRSRQEIYALFGNPGAGKPDRAWARDNIITVRDLPGVPRKWHVQVHRLIEPNLREGLRRVSVASDYEIGRIAGYVFRHIRNDARRPLSLHAWGVAIDVDPRRNYARTFHTGTGPEPFSAEWRDAWPQGIDLPFVRAMESVGFTWGGVWGKTGGDLAARARAASYFDPMHFEFRQRG